MIARKEMEKTLKEYGIKSEAELLKAIKEMPALDIAVFTKKVNEK